MIRQEGGKWVLYSMDGSRKLGEFDTEQQAMDREHEIQRLAHQQEAIDPQSLSGRMERIRSAFRAHGDRGGFPKISEYGGCPDVVEIYPAVIVCRNAQGYWRVPYQGPAADGTVTFGEPERVAMEFVPMSEAEIELRALAGSAWEVRVIRAGYSQAIKEVPGTGGRTGRWLYTQEAIRDAPAIFERAPVYAFEFDRQRFSHLWGIGPAEKAKKGLVQNLIGYLEQVRESGGELLARLNLLTDRATEAVKEKLLDLYRRGRQDLVGLSIDSRVFGIPVETAEGLTFAVLRFAQPATVDVATHPAAGGAFLRALEALPEKEVTVLKELLEKLRARRPDLAAKLGDNPTEAQVKEAFIEAFGSLPSEAKPIEKALADVRAVECRILLRDRLAEAKLPEPIAERIRKQFEGIIFEPAALEAVVKEAQALVEVRGTECRMLLRDRLAEAKLPKSVEERMKKQFAGTIFEAPALEAAIRNEKELLDALEQEGYITGLGTPRARVQLEQQQKHQIGMDRMFGVETKESKEVSPKDVPAFRGFQHAFKIITGHDLLDMFNHPITTAQEAILAATWPNVLGASMHRRLIKDYLAPAYGETSIISVRPGGVANFKTQETERVKYFADLSEFDPESLDYPEIGEPGDEKVTYIVIQKGNILTISRKVMLNDDLGAVTKMVGRLGRAARRTHAKFFWNFWINNSTYEVDALAWFHATHGNLKSQALTADMAGAGEVLDALVKLGKMTEPGSGERLGLPNFRDLLLWLIVPIDLLGVARQLNVSQTLPNASNVQVPNPIYHLFGPNDERVIVNALLTDVSDWGVFRDSSEVDSIEAAYLNDQREPEFFVASVPTVGQMFVADKQQFKVRHEYGGDIVDFRGAVKSVAA